MTNCALGATKAGWIGLRSFPITVAEGYRLGIGQRYQLGSQGIAGVNVLRHIQGPDSCPGPQIQDILRID